jgi:hypothetical protein
LIELVEAAFELQEFFEDQGWEYCLIGGLAMLRWGEPRFTQDVDVTLLTRFQDEEGYVDPLLGRFAARAENMRDFALTRRVILLKSSKGIGMDVALGGLPFEESVVARSSMYEYHSGRSLRTCSAEDLVVMKAFASRDQDWLDIKGILIRQGNRLDWPYILEQLPPLCELKEDPAIVPRLERLREELQEEENHR